jgi:copper oxidase (laccase) domain-containing protein
MNAHPESAPTPDQAPTPERQSPTGTWWMSDHEPQPLIIMTIGTAGPSRETAPDQRYRMAGNMSARYDQPGHPNQPAQTSLSPEQRAQEANANVSAALRAYGLEPSQTAILRANIDYSQPLQVLDVDNPAVFQAGTSPDATWLEAKGDFLITRDPEKVLAVRPADCPCIVGRGLDGNGKEVLFLAHYPWRGANAGFLEQGLAYLHTQGVDLSSLRLYITPGMRPETAKKYFHSPVNPVTTQVPGSYTHPDRAHLFTNVEPATNEAGETIYKYGVDVQGFLRYKLREAGLSDWQVYEDETDSAHPKAGHHSHSRAVNYPDAEVKGADLVFASLHNPLPSS